MVGLGAVAAAAAAGALAAGAGTWTATLGRLPTAADLEALQRAASARLGAAGGGGGAFPLPRDYLTGLGVPAAGIPFEGPASTNPLAFKYFDAHREVCVPTAAQRGGAEGGGGGEQDCRKMKDWLKFSLAFWHTMRGDGSDMFGAPTVRRPWELPGTPALSQAVVRLQVFFDIAKRLGVEYWCWHDRDIAPEGGSLRETNANLDAMVEVAKRLQDETGIRTLWGTAQLFKHPRYMHGAATSPDAGVFAFAAAQVKKAMEATLALGGQGFVFWGGREGYQSLRNTDMAQEMNHQATFMSLAVDHKKEIGFDGVLLVEPKPQEPTKHQYDWDVATSALTLYRHGLQEEYKINVECNHATLSGHTCEHEVELASSLGLWGNLDVNVGDAQTGWDTDQFHMDPKEAAALMRVLLRQGGFPQGGLNFDAKLRRESTDVLDIFYAHIGGMDTMARGLLAAAEALADGRLEAFVAERYRTFAATELGRAIEERRTSFAALEAHALRSPDPVHSLASGQQEKAEIIAAQYQ